MNKEINKIKIVSYENKYYSQVKNLLKEVNLYWHLTDNKKSLKEKILKFPNSIIIANLNEKIVGTLFITIDFHPLLFRLSVHPNYRNLGIGKTLMKKAEKILKKKGFNHASILVSSNNKNLHNFYKKIGYEIEDEYVWMFKKFK